MTQVLHTNKKKSHVTVACLFTMFRLILAVQAILDV